MSTTVNPVPAGMHTVTPHLICDGAAEAIEFYVRAFGATSSGAMQGPDGKVNSAEFVLAGQTFLSYEGGPHFSFSQGISLFVRCIHGLRGNGFPLEYRGPQRE